MHNNLNNHIEFNAAVMMGKPVIKGTRITVAAIVEELASGYTVADVMQAHPNLTEKDIMAALQYAAAVLQNERIFTTFQ